jgi:fatty-acyl-CoA synthase
MPSSSPRNTDTSFVDNLTPNVAIQFLDRVEKSPDAEAYRFPRGESWESVTWQQTGTEVSRLAAGLLALGIEMEQRVGIASGTRYEWILADLAIMCAGGATTTVYPSTNAEDTAYILSDSECRVVFAEDDEQIAKLQERKAELPHLLKVVTFEGAADGDWIIGLEDLAKLGEEYLAEHPDVIKEKAEAIRPDQLATLIYTSGTTGRPKGVMVHHRGAYLNAIGETLETGLTFASTYLWTLPMFHCNGWCFTWGVTAHGATHVCLRKVDPARIWDLIDREGITHYCGAPTVQIGIVNDPKAHALSRPVTCAVAGAPPSPTLLGRLKELGFRPVHIYGLTETYGPHTVCAWNPEWDDLPIQEQARLAARQGQGFVIADLVRVVDDRMADVPLDGETLGEVVMRGNNVMKGYFEQPEASAEAFRGGWFHSGDLAVWHADGYIELRDRKKDIIISGGENISTIEVEQTVARHPAVMECAVVAVPDAKWGERPKAFVTLKKGREATEEEIIDFVKGRIARYKAPAAVEFVEELPKTSTGKIQKFVLRDGEWAGRESKVT